MTPPKNPGGLSLLGPASGADPVAPRRSSSASGTLQRRSTPAVASILLVDDKAANLLALEAILAPLGHRLVRAYSGEDALKHVLSEEFAAILMDVQMPDLDGFRTARFIKERERSRHVPIIFMTAISRDDAHIFKGYQHGAVDYLLKPFDPHILRCKVSVFVELFQQREQIRLQAEMLRAQERDATERERMYELERIARREAEAATRAREEILAVVSHDLRNPLNAICASTALLSRYLDSDQEPRSKLHKQLALIEHSVERMSRLVGDWLDLMRIEDGRLTLRLETHDIGSIVEQAIDMIEPLAGQRGQHINCRVEASLEERRIDCDKERVLQVLSNLLGNAVKFSKEGSTLELSVEARPDGVRVRVHDQGPGIDPHALPHIFERYWQAPGQNLGPGVGLGLAIAKGLIDAHGGRIGAVSELGRGSEFWFELGARGSSSGT